MSLILEGFALAVEGAALVIDCACCIKEKCEAIACAKDIDCDDAGLTPDAECFCRQKKCTSNPSCVDDTDCPDGYECVDGRCVPECRGQPCTGDGDCLDNCVCLEGGCWNEDNVYYCHGDPEDTSADGECSQGVPAVSKGGPYLTYGLCAQSGCKSKFSCNSVVCDCYPDPAGIYDDLVSCQQACCGGSGDLGRCCESRVTYDVNGDVTNVVQGEAPCCPSCTKDQCISDPPLQNGQAGTRKFRQFNSLFDNCDLCPTVTIGPCCYEEDGVPTCGMHDRGECENVLDGEWKGNNWFDCENARDPDVDLLLDFACPDCNGAGDCACGGDGYCYGQKCHDCNNPTTVDTDAQGTIIYNNPKVGDKWKFRVRSCIDGVSYPEQDINIFAERPDGTRKLVTTINNADGDIDSLGRTVWTFEEEGCFSFLVAQKMVGDPDEAQLCMEKEAAGNPLPPPGCEPPSGSCVCPDEFTPNCPDDQRDLVYTYGPSPAPPQDQWKFKDDAPECRTKYVFMWFQETGFQSYDEEIPCEDFFVTNTVEESFSRFKYLMWKPGAGGGWTDVTDAYVEGLPYTPPGYNEVPNGLSLELREVFDGCNGINEYVAASEGLVDIAIPCEVPDLNANCPQFRNMQSENPLP